MNRLMLKFYLKLQALREEHGQDMIEYVLVGAVVGLGCIAGMGNFAGNINAAFTKLGTVVSGYVT